MKTRVWVLLGCLGLAIWGLSSCFFGHSYEKNESDIEDPNIPAVSSGLCEGAEILSVESLYKEPYLLADALPTEDARVAFEGKPLGGLVCTQLGCDFECCDNSCGYSGDCPFSLKAADGYNYLCLRLESFACGGTDCSPWCEPFSTEPAHDYRFVGKLRYTGKLSAALEVEAFCRL